MHGNRIINNKNPKLIKIYGKYNKKYINEQTQIEYNRVQCSFAFSITFFQAQKKKYGQSLTQIPRMSAECLVRSRAFILGNFSLFPSPAASIFFSFSVNDPCGSACRSFFSPECPAFLRHPRPPPLPHPGRIAVRERRTLRACGRP